jgi:hypothetical protein
MNDNNELVEYIDNEQICKTTGTPCKCGITCCNECFTGGIIIKGIAFEDKWISQGGLRDTTSNVNLDASNIRRINIKERE